MSQVPSSLSLSTTPPTHLNFSPNLSVSVAFHLLLCRSVDIDHNLLMYSSYWSKDARTDSSCV